MRTIPAALVTLTFLFSSGKAVKAETRPKTTRLDLDVGVTAIMAPANTVDSGTVIVPQATVRNFGTLDTAFPVTMLIGSAYTRTVLETLSAGDLDTVVFPAWLASPLGSIPIICFTSLIGDSNRTNDTVRSTVTVTRVPVHDVGTAVILSPPELLYAGDTCIPKAIIRNYGNTVERHFDVRFRIGVVYNQVVRVNSPLLPEGTVDVVFPPWVAQTGYYPASCSTMLGPDTNPENDKIKVDIAVLSRPILRVEWDQTEHLQFAERKTVSFFAELISQQSDVIELRPPVAPTGWQVLLCDSAGQTPLIDTDADGLPDLGPLFPGRRAHFTLQVLAPPDLIGPVDSSGGTVVIHGFTRRDSTVADSAILSLHLLPELTIHNYPNPCQHRTTFIFGLPERGKVRLTIYDRAGERVYRLIDNISYDTGIAQIRWNCTNEHGRAVAPGTYDYVFEHEAGGRTRRIVKRLLVTCKPNPAAPLSK